MTSDISSIFNMQHKSSDRLSALPRPFRQFSELSTLDICLLTDALAGGTDEFTYCMSAVHTASVSSQPIPYDSPCVAGSVDYQVYNF